MDDISIQQLTPERMQEAVDLTCRVFGEEWRHYAKIDFEITFSDYPNAFSTLIAIKDDKVIGLTQCVSAHTGGTYTIVWVCVEEELQGQGIGSHMLQKSCEHIETEFLKGSAGTVFLATGKPEFYEKAGFKRGPEIHTGDLLMLKIIEGTN